MHSVLHRELTSNEGLLQKKKTPERENPTASCLSSVEFFCWCWCAELERDIVDAVISLLINVECRELKQFCNSIFTDVRYAVAKNCPITCGIPCEPYPVEFAPRNLCSKDG
ncbi:hypothetical protein ACROYT_G018947 [Oculina patagonica]